MIRETWFRKQGRKYIPVVEAEKYDYESMPAQGFTLTYRKDGVTQWEYEVKPDNASFIAAAMVARVAMEDALRTAATYAPRTKQKFTKKQLALIEQFKTDMGMDYPNWWHEASSRDIAQAGIDAVTENTIKAAKYA